MPCDEVNEGGEHHLSLCIWAISGADCGMKCTNYSITASRAKASVKKGVDRYCRLNFLLNPVTLPRAVRIRYISKVHRAKKNISQHHLFD